MISIFVNRNGETRTVDQVEPQWLDPKSGVTLWVDLAAFTEDEGKILTDTFHFHPLAVEDALSAVQYPKIEAYDSYLYIIPPRHRLRGRAPVRHARCRLLPRCELPGDRARRALAEHREDARDVPRCTATSSTKGRSR
jgi:hypothetical protein